MRRLRLYLIALIALLVLGLAVWFYLFYPGRFNPTTPRPKPAPIALDTRYLCRYPDPIHPPAVETGQCTDCSDYAVDKFHRLPANYRPSVVPTGLTGGGSMTREAARALGELFAAAKRRGISPRVTSAYRSYDDQVLTFNGWLAQELRRSNNLDRAFDNASRYSARPGFSEHQLGTAVDVNCDGCVAFDTSDERNQALWKFLEDESYVFGFAISYPQNVEPLTGYQYEPWHIRYVGTEYATRLYEQGYTEGNGVCLASFLRAQAN